jgi:hypothetical protein
MPHVEESQMSILDCSNCNNFPMATPKTFPLWGYLQPLLHIETSDDYSLPLPGSYGREDLIRPHLDSCPCRKRSVDKDKSPKKTRCGNCNSVKSLAKFIPRKDMLHFSVCGSGNGLKLEILGNNSTEIVHLNCKSQPTDCSLVLHHHDEISLYWEELGIATTDSENNNAKYLIRFRVIRGEQIVDLGCILKKATEKEVSGVRQI